MYSGVKYLSIVLVKSKFESEYYSGYFKRRCKASSIVAIITVELNRFKTWVKLSNLIENLLNRVAKLVLTCMNDSKDQSSP